MEIVIDERRNDADFGQAHPKAYIFGSIFHEERHRVPLGIAPAQEIVGHSVTVRLHLKQGITGITTGTPDLLAVERSFKTRQSSILSRLSDFLSAIKASVM